MIVLFADPALKALAVAVAQSPAQFGWLLDWQRQEFEKLMPADQNPHFEQFIGALIAENFTMQPSSGPAFMQMGSQFYGELKRNSTRLPLVEALDLPVKVIWGEYDPYLGVAMGRERAAHFKKWFVPPGASGTLAAVGHAGASCRADAVMTRESTLIGQSRQPVRLKKGSWPFPRRRICPS